MAKGQTKAFLGTWLMWTVLLWIPLVMFVTWLGFWLGGDDFWNDTTNPIGFLLAALVPTWVFTWLGYRRKQPSE